MITEQQIQSNKHFPELDGLRGIAILMVLCYHYFQNFPILNFGWTGVDLFFVLSGYLISSRLIPFINEKGIVRIFYWNRFLRIVPLYFSFLLVFFIGWFFLNSNETISNNPFYSKFYWEFLVFIQNWGFIEHINDNKTHLQHLWSIAIEEQIYLIFPWLLIFARKTNRLFLCILFLFLLVPIIRTFYAFNYTNEQYLKIYWNTFLRADSFFAGTMVYLILNYHSKIKFAKYFIWVLGIISGVTILTCILITKDTEKNNIYVSSIGYTIISLFFASILYSILYKRENHKYLILRNTFLRYTGRISYGIYIFHWPLFILGFAIINKACLKTDISLTLDCKYLINAVFCIPMTYLISHISFKYFEAFFLNWKIKYK